MVAAVFYGLVPAIALGLTAGVAQAMGKISLDATIQRLPEIYRKLARVGSYGAFFPYYICGVSFRVSDLQGQTAVFPWIKQETGRCVDE